jgi:hypothetical protein
VHSTAAYLAVVSGSIVLPKANKINQISREASRDNSEGIFESAKAEMKDVHGLVVR